MEWTFWPRHAHCELQIFLWRIPWRGLYQTEYRSELKFVLKMQKVIDFRIFFCYAGWMSLYIPIASGLNVIICIYIFQKQHCIELSDDSSITTRCSRQKKRLVNNYHKNMKTLIQEATHHKNHKKGMQTYLFKIVKIFQNMNVFLIKWMQPWWAKET